MNQILNAQGLLEIPLELMFDLVSSFARCGIQSLGDGSIPHKFQQSGQTVCICNLSGFLAVRDLASVNFYNIYIYTCW